MRALSIAATGMSAQEKNLEVIANNIANINTDGFKADRSIFEEYLMPVARSNQFRGRDTVLS